MVQKSSQQDLSYHDSGNNDEEIFPISDKSVNRTSLSKLWPYTREGC